MPLAVTASAASHASPAHDPRKGAPPKPRWSKA
jgi:hypothetical protein